VVGQNKLKKTKIIILSVAFLIIGFFSIQGIYAQSNELTGEQAEKMREAWEYNKQQKLIRSILEPAIPIIVIGIIALVVIKVVLPRTRLSKRK